MSDENLNDFMYHHGQINVLLARLKDLADDHFDTNPEEIRKRDVVRVGEIHRLLQHALTATSYVVVDYEINMGGLFEGEGWDDVDQEASGDNYRAMLDNALQGYYSRYGSCAIKITEVHYSGNDRLYVEIDGEDVTKDERPFVEYLAGKVFHNFEWVVERVVENDTEDA